MSTQPKRAKRSLDEAAVVGVSLDEPLQSSNTLKNSSDGTFYLMLCAALASKELRFAV